jgi:digeranylgeranylglycerophospholipid reductase
MCVRRNNTEVAILGGAVSGLAAASGLVRLESDHDITVFERQEYDNKRVNCGEAINDTSLIPIEISPENGFVNDIDGFQLRVYDVIDRDPTSPPIGVSNLVCDTGYICERDIVEKRWAESLKTQGVEFRTGESISVAEYWEIVDSYDRIIDATGQPSLSMKARDMTDRYTGDMVALNATVKGDFSEYVNMPRIFFEGYVGYSWSFPKSERHANVGIGWAGDERPNNYITAMKSASERVGFPTPDRDDINIYTIPRGPSLDPNQAYFDDDSVFLVGDAAGIANRYQGEGICQGIRSSYMLCDLIENGTEGRYPQELYELMKSEYRLAHLMRGAWVEHEDPELLAAIAESLEGLTIDQITRSPTTVFRRLLRNPRVTANLVSDAGIWGRIYQAYTNNWEYSEGRVSHD